MTALRLEEALRHARHDALAPPPLLSLSEWAALHARLSVGANAMPGKFEAFEYQKGWLDAITDPAVRQVTVMKSARVGYTRCLDHAVGYFIHQDPSPVLFVMPRIEDCEDFSRSEILPMLTDTPVLAALVGDIKTRDANQRILKRQFRNGASVAFVGANSPAGFRRISARVVLFDEVDGFPLEAGFEGDQIALGIKRTETFWNRKIVVGSTPTLKYQSRVEKAFADSDQRYFHVACPSCRHYQVLRFENLRWDKAPDGTSRIGGAASRGAHRLRAAAAQDEVPRSGVLYQILGPDGGPLFKIGIDADGAILFELGGSCAVGLPGDEGAELLAAFKRLGEHARMIGGGNAQGLASAGPASGNPLAALHARLDRLVGW